MKFSRIVREHQRGFALAEMMLAVVIVGLIFGYMGPMLTRTSDAQTAKSVAADYTGFKTAVSQHFEANRAAYVAAMTNGTDANKLCMVNVDPLTGLGGTSTFSLAMHRCALDGSMLKFLNVLPASVRDTNRYGEHWVAVFKQSYDTAVPPVPTGSVEMIIVSARVDGTTSPLPADPRTYAEAQTAARFAGGQGGVVPEADRSTCVASRAANTYQACGAGWLVTLDNFLDSAEITAFSNRLSN